MAGEVSSQLRRDYVWNTASSLLGSASMVLMLLVVTRVAGIQAAGIYSIATAIGQQFQTVGSYEVRPYQATDVKAKFTFGTYYSTRIITIVAMAAAIVIYTVLFGNAQSDLVVILLVASLRIFDAFEDVFYGEFQRLGRLDLAGRANFFRVLVTTTVFIAGIVVTKSLLISTIATIVATIIAIAFLIFPPAARMFSLRLSFQIRQIRHLLVECFPLFGAAFLSIYLTNAPRFAIERYGSMDLQGYYAILFMPALGINILAMFIFRPLLTRMAMRWSTSDIDGFSALVKRGLQGVTVAFMLTGIAVFFIGIPILELLYGVDLGNYRTELLILVAGGAFNAFAVILYYALTTMRRQRLLLVGYVAAAVLVWALSELLVPSTGLWGAAMAYSTSMLALVTFFGLILVGSLIKARRKHLPTSSERNHREDSGDR